MAPPLSSDMEATLFTFAFMVVVNRGIALFWEQAKLAIGLDPRLFTLLVCTGGGLLVGLLVRLFGDLNDIFSEIMKEFGKTGRFDYRNAPGSVITAIVSLIFGGSLGPEAPLVEATSVLSELADVMRNHEMVFFGSSHNTIPLCYIDNLVDAFVLALTHDEVVGQGYLRVTVP